MKERALATSSTESSPKTPSGPRGHFLLGHAPDVRHDVQTFCLRLAHEYGDVARIRLLATPVYLVSHPDGIRQILQKKHLNYDRYSFSYKPMRPFLGNGLAISNGELWQRQRRLIQPAFHRQHVIGMATQVVKAGNTLLQHWENRDHQDEPLDIHQEMVRVMLDVVSMTFFGLDLNAEHPMIQAFNKLIPAQSEYLFFPFPPLSVPTPRNRRIRASLNTLNTLIYDLVRKRRERKGDAEDLLSLLLASYEDGASMDNQQLRDEMMSLFFAGYETTANTLVWALYELSRHPEIAHRLWKEIDMVLHGEYPAVEHLSQLSYTRMVIDEALRRYPQASMLPRRALADDTICGYHIPANSQVFTNIYASHHHPAYWEQTKTFDPDRFLPDHPCEGARTAYFPFGGGPHLCIGNSLALMEAQILLSMIVQRYQLVLAPGQTVEPVMRLSVRPRDGVFMYLKGRK